MAEESTKPPKVFISYAWEDDVKPWVKTLAKQLRKDGVDAIFDEWAAVPGDQLPEFMEKSIRESDFVIVICTPKYKDKSDKRKGGVGYEGNIITSEIFQNNNNRKFIAILRKSDWEFALPSWAAGKLSMDLRGDPYSKKNYQELLRVLHNKWYTPPPVGRPPDFPDDEDDDGLNKPKPKVPRNPLIFKDSVAKFLASLRISSQKSIPLFRITGILIFVGLILWGGSQALPQLLSAIPTVKATTTQRPVAIATSTNSSVIPSKTLKPNPTSTKAQTLVPTALPTEITDAKGVQMVFVPEGKFIMGTSNKDFTYYLDVDQNPAHNVLLNAFYVDKYEVTNSLYRVCVDGGICTKPHNRSSNNRPQYYGNSEFDNYPVIYVDWYQAKAYCEWRGARLPSEAEWEKSARGTDGRYYSWADNVHGQANTTGVTVWTGDTTKVGSYPSGKSPYGAYDMIGNVWEWVNDWYKNDYYSTLGDTAVNPQGPSQGDSKVLRGSSWTPCWPAGGGGCMEGGNVSTFNRHRDYPSRFYYDVGFRCAKDATP